MKKTVLSLLCLAAFPALASDLPPEIEAMKAITNAPMVKESEAGVDMESANDAKFKSGPYEYNVLMTGDRRKDEALRQTLSEWSIQVARPIRLPGKAALDREIGKKGLSTAEIARGDSLHESAKSLLHLWFTWMREKLQETEWKNQVKLLSEEVAVVEKRVRAGDAPRLELNLARAAADQAKFSELQAEMREDVAARNLTVNYPEIVLPEKPDPSDPEPVSESLEYWKDKILASNHAIRLARSRAERALLLSKRSREDRIPDPTIGVNYSSEYGGSQKVVGGLVSFPLPGDFRKAGARSAAAAAEMALQREVDVRRKTEADISSNYIMAKASYNGWEKSREAADGMIRNAHLVSVAYALGEASLSDLLTARRLSIESQLASRLAQVDALETRYRLKVDAHMLWDFDEGKNTRQQ